MSKHDAISAFQLFTLCEFLEHEGISEEIKKECVKMALDKTTGSYVGSTSVGDIKKYASTVAHITLDGVKNEELSSHINQKVEADLMAAIRGYELPSS